jgi:hypothetical protein
MNLFTRLPISLASSLYPVIPEADIDYFTDYEPGAYAHWVFNKGGAAGLTDLKAGKVLVPQSDAPTYSANYLSMNGAVGKGLLTDLLEPAATKRTMFAVVREPNPAVTQVKVPFGTMDSSAGTGGLPFLSGSGAARKLFTTYKAVTNSSDTLQLTPASSWLCLAVTLDFSGGTKQVRTLVGGGAGHEATSAVAFAASVRALALGNGFYATGHASPLDFAEFIVFEGRAMSLADMQAVYLRRKAKLAAGGIAVV